MPPSPPQKPSDAFYRVPLSSGEVLATLAALRALADLLNSAGVNLAPDSGILESAGARIADQVPEFLRDRAERLGDELAAALVDALGTANENNDTLDRDKHHGMPPFRVGRTRRLLESALQREKLAEIEYYVASRGEWTTRAVEVSDVYDVDETWYLSGHCRLRDDFRHFRLDHIRAVRVLEDEDELEYPAPFDEESGMKKGIGEQSGAFDGRRQRAGRRVGAGRGKPPAGS